MFSVVESKCIYFSKYFSNYRKVKWKLKQPYQNISDYIKPNTRMDERALLWLLLLMMGPIAEIICEAFLFQPLRVEELRAVGGSQKLLDCKCPEMQTKRLKRIFYFDFSTPTPTPSHLQTLPFSLLNKLEMCSIRAHLCMFQDWQIISSPFFILVDEHGNNVPSLCNTHWKRLFSAASHLCWSWTGREGPPRS